MIFPDFLWCDSWLVGGAKTMLKNDGVRQWVSDDIPYMKWKIIHSRLKPTRWEILISDGFFHGEKNHETIGFFTKNN